MAFSQSAWKIQFNNFIPAVIYLLKVNSRNTNTRCEICSKLTIKIPERRQCRRNYARSLTQHHVELTNSSMAKPQAFSDLKTFGLVASLSGNKFSTIPGDLVNEVTINREVKVKGGPMRGGCSTSIDAENDFILNSHILAKLRKELKSKINFKTD